MKEGHYDPLYDDLGRGYPGRVGFYGEQRHRRHWIPLALDGIQFVPLPGDQEIHFPALLVAPVRSSGSRCTRRLRPASVSRNFRLAARVDEPVARIFSFGNRSAPILSSRAGSHS